MDDAQLLEATARGDADAFSLLYRRHLGRVVSFALRATGDPELAADLAGEVFAAALEQAGRYRPEHPSASPWLLGIARNKLLESRRRGRIEDAARRRLAIAPLALTDADIERLHELAALEGNRALAAVQALPAAERDAVVARVIDERGYREIAAELRCSESVVRQRVSRGLARARARLGRAGDGFGGGA
ncbi:MAG TPA: RNA polymerase sigma factor [Solirubrobacteraceae bacterium]|nr:RNA polymerase sigma factor [Solirubrobacteraceae bacterium]